MTSSLFMNWVHNWISGDSYMALSFQFEVLCSRVVSSNLMVCPMLQPGLRIGFHFLFHLTESSSKGHSPWANLFQPSQPCEIFGTKPCMVSLKPHFLHPASLFSCPTPCNLHMLETRQLTQTHRGPFSRGWKMHAGEELHSIQILLFTLLKFT